MLQPPPADSEATGAQTSRPQTQADKIVEKYDALGKEQGHVYGAVGSSIPNFNVKPGSEPKQAAALATSPQVPAPSATAPPAILGARPSPKPAAAKTANPQAHPAGKPDAVLPLGAPRHKPATLPALPDPQKPQPPPQQ